MRDGSPVDLPATELVPGDVVLLGEGERISADARLLQGALEVDISTLTGESLTGSDVVAFMSDNHLQPDLAIEVFVLDRQLD